MNILSHGIIRGSTNMIDLVGVAPAVFSLNSGRIPPTRINVTNTLSHVIIRGSTNMTNTPIAFSLNSGRIPPTQTNVTDTLSHRIIRGSTNMIDLIGVAPAVFTTHEGSRRPVSLQPAVVDIVTAVVADFNCARVVLDSRWNGQSHCRIIGTRYGVSNCCTLLKYALARHHWMHDIIIGNHSNLNHRVQLV